MKIINQTNHDKYTVLETSPPTLVALNVDADEVDILLGEPWFIDSSPEGIAIWRSTFTAALARLALESETNIHELTGQILALQQRAESADEVTSGMAAILRQLQDRLDERDRAETKERIFKRRMEAIAAIDGISVKEAEREYGDAVRIVL